jgi:pyridoxamine 5'-phosphate oxidase family protein
MTRRRRRRDTTRARCVSASGYGPLSTGIRWSQRGVEVRGRAELHEEAGERFGRGWDSAWIRIVPERIVSWGIEAPSFSGAGLNARSVR